MDYKPKNILVTGGAGFIASNLIVKFVKKYPDYKIVNFDKLDYCSSLKNLDEIKDAPNYKFVHGNILSADLVKHILQSEDIDTVMHFAAQSHVDNSFGNSILFTENNVMGTHVLLEAVKNYGQLKRFIHVSTDEVYGEQTLDQDGMIETSVLEPTNPYAATKASAEFIAKSYYRSFQLPIIITRGNNVYGPRQYPEKVIPKFYNQLIRGKPCTIHGDGKNMRNFLYIDDVVEAFDTVLHRGITGQVYNIGGNKENEISNLEVAQRLIKLLELDSGNNDNSNDEGLIQFVENRPFNDLRYNIDSSKLHALGWYPKVNFDEGLRRTVEWYRLYSNNWSSIENALKAHPSSLFRGESTERHITY